MVRLEISKLLDAMKNGKKNLRCLKALGLFCSCFSPVKNGKRFYTMPLLKKRHRRVGVAERPCSSQNSTLQSETWKMGRKRETRLLIHYPRKKMVPTKAHSVQNFRFHSLGCLGSRALDLLPNHNVHYKLKMIKLKKLR